MLTRLGDVADKFTAGKNNGSCLSDEDFVTCTGINVGIARVLGRRCAVSLHFWMNLNSDLGV